jgi:hypothetical protein
MGEAAADDPVFTLRDLNPQKGDAEWKMMPL